MKRHSRIWFFLMAILISSISFLPIGQVFGQEEPPINYYLPFFTTYQDPDYAFGLDGGTVENVIVDPNDSAIIYAGTWGNGIYKSLDGGKTWEIHITDELWINGLPISTGGGLRSAFIYEIAIDPLNSDHLLASVYEHGVDQSFDGGLTWESTGGFEEGYFVAYSIDFDSSESLGEPGTPEYRSKYVYAAIREQTIGSTYPGGVWKSDDGGDSWGQVTRQDNGFSEEDYIYDLAIDPDHPQTVYTANHRTGVYKTTDGGVSWEKVSRGLVHQDIRGIQVNPTNGRIYAGIWDSYGFAYSTNGGESWVNNSWSNNADLYVYEIQYDPKQPDNIYLTTDNGIYFCENPTAYSQCSLIANKGKFVFDLALDLNLSSEPASNGRTRVMYTGLQHFGVNKSDNGGISFDPSYQGIRANIVRTISVDPLNSDIQYVSASYRGLYRSSDGGQTWMSLHEALGLEFINEVVFTPGTSETVYIADKYGGIYYSLDGGDTWLSGNSGISRSISPEETDLISTPSNVGIDESDYGWMDPVDFQDLADAIGTTSPDRVTTITISSIGFSPVDSTKLFAGMNPGGVIYSDTGGVTWNYSDLTTGGVLETLVDPGPTAKYLVGTKDSVVKVSDDRKHWNQLGDGFPSGTYVYSLALQDDGVYIAGTNQGVYRLEEGATWENLGFTDIVRDLIVDPTNSDMIWLATLEGLYYGTPTGTGGAYEWTKYNMVDSNNERMFVIEVISVSDSTREFYVGMDGGDIYHLIEEGDLLP